MDIFNEIETRRSVKSYKLDAIEPEIIERVIKAGTYAPSVKNMQSPIIIAITNREVRNNISNILKQLRGGLAIDPFYDAPIVLVVLAKKEIPTYICDGSCVMENMLLEAHSLGLGACWIHHAKEVFETEYGKELLNKLGINYNEYEGIGHCIIGCPKHKNMNIIPRKENYVYYVR